MSCDEFTESPKGRRGIGVVQPQSGLDYPFVAPSDDVRYLFADFYLAYDDPGLYRTDVPAAEHPLRVKWLYGVGCAPASAPAWAPTPVHAADILIVDANDQTVFDSTQLVPAGGDSTYHKFDTRAWGPDYDIYEWIGNNAVCRLVVYKTWQPTDEPAPRNWPAHLVPESAVLDERTVTRMPKRLKSLRVKSGALTLDPGKRTGIIFGGGNNIRLATAALAAAGVRNETQITFIAEPGAGTGKYADCTADATSPIYSIGGARANEYGDFTITSGDCLWTRRPTALVAPGVVTPIYANSAPVIAIGSNCPACCDCPDYRETALYMNRVRNRYKKIGARTHEAKLLHENNIERWVTQRDCRLQKPLRAFLTPQFCPLLDVVLMFCNQQQRCAQSVTMTANFSTYPDNATAELVCGHTTMYAPGVAGKPFAIDGAWPVFSATLPPVDVGNSAYVKFRLRLTPNNYPYAVTVNLTGELDGAPILLEPSDPTSFAYGSDSAALSCDENGNTLECQQ